MVEGKVVLEERLVVVVFLGLQEELMMKTGISNAKIPFACNVLHMQQYNFGRGLNYHNE